MRYLVIILLLSSVTFSQGYQPFLIAPLQTGKSIGMELSSVSMHRDVFGVVHDTKICGSIVDLVPVDMVSDFAVSKFSPDMCFQNSPMFQYPCPFNAKPTVSISSDVSCAFISRGAFMTTKLLGTVFPPVVLPAMQTRNLNYWLGLSASHAGSLDTSVVEDAHATDVGRAFAFLDIASGTNTDRIFPFAVMRGTQSSSVDDVRTIRFGTYISHACYDNATGKAKQG
jgi:hypothetical protein